MSVITLLSLSAHTWIACAVEGMHARPPSYEDAHEGTDSETLLNDGSSTSRLVDADEHGLGSAKPTTYYGEGSFEPPSSDDEDDDIVMMEEKPLSGRSPAFAQSRLPAIAQARSPRSAQIRSPRILQHGAGDVEEGGGNAKTRQVRKEYDALGRYTVH